MTFGQLQTSRPVVTRQLVVDEDDGVHAQS
jgi:hypothetical protein